MPDQIEIIKDGDYGFWKMIVEAKGAVEIRSPLEEDLDRMTNIHPSLSLVAVDYHDNIIGTWFKDFDPNRPWISLGEGHILHKA